MNANTLLVGIVAALSIGQAAAQNTTFTSVFPIDDYTFSTVGGQPYFILNPGHQLVLKGMEDGEQKVLTITVLDDIKEIPLKVGGEQRVIQTRVIEERETVDGELSEVARNFFAQCIETGDVYYFGEDVDFYKNGKIVRHDGTWLAGVGNAQPGIIMPGNFVVGAQYFQESAPGVAMDFAVNSATGVTMTVPAGTFTNCVTVTETNPLKPGDDPENKTYAPGIGIVNNAGILKLTAFTDPSAASGLPALVIQDALLLTWPVTEKAFRMESSSDLRNWVPLPQRSLPVDGRNQLWLPRESAQKFFRLANP